MIARKMRRKEEPHKRVYPVYPVQRYNQRSRNCDMKEEGRLCCREMVPSLVLVKLKLTCLHTKTMRSQ